MQELRELFRELKNPWLAFALFFMIVLIVILYSMPVARADEPHKHRPQDLGLHHKLYKQWKMPDNRAVSCCNDDDCRPAEAYKKGGQWYARHEGDTGDFTLIPPHKVDIGLPDSPESPDARAHLCGVRYGSNDGPFTVYCFTAGSGG